MDLNNYAGMYNFMMELPSAPCGINFGQLIPGTLKRLVELLETIMRKPLKARKTSAPITAVPKGLKLVTAKVHGTEIDVPLDFSPIPNFYQNN